MNINSLSPNVVNILSQGILNSNTDNLSSDGDTVSDFANILTEALKTASETDKVDKASSLDLLMGNSDDIAGLMLDMQKAELSLNLALQIRNKVIDAYNEIMRMSV